MPYDLFTKKVKGKKKYCMTSKDSGKTYCSNSAAARKKMMKLHEAFKTGWKPTGKAKTRTQETLRLKK